MSASANSSAAASPAPAPAAPRSAPVPPHPPHSGRKWLIAGGLAAVAAAAWLLKPAPQAQKPAVAVTLRTAKAAIGTFQRTVRLTGSTSARNYANVTAPMMRGPDAGRALVLIELAKSGAMVKKGELLAQIDPQSIKDHVDDVNALVVQAESDIKKKRAEQAIEMETLRQSLRVAKATLDKAKLDYGAQEIRNPIDQEQLKLSVEEAEATYARQQKDLATSEASNVSELRLLELTRDRHVRHRDRHAVDVERFTVKAPIPGLVVMQTIFRGGDMAQVQLGDQVSPGQPFMKIVDVSSMQVEATANQVESEYLRLGQKADINFDAFPDLHLTGKLQAIGALAVGGWRQDYYIRKIPVRVAIEGRDERVIPDLSASADVIIGEKPNALLVPAEAVQTDGAGKTFVQVKAGDRLERRDVQVAESSHTKAMIAAGLQPGEEVVLNAPPATKPAPQK